MKKILHILIKLSIFLWSLPFIAIIGSVTIGTAFDTRNIIESENRRANTYHEIRKNFLDNSFQNSLEKRLQDQLFKRSFFMKIAERIDKLGNDYYYQTIYIDGHKISFVDGGKKILVDGRYWFGKYSYTFSEEQLKKLDESINWLSSPSGGNFNILVLPEFATNLLFQKAWPNSTVSNEEAISSVFLKHVNKNFKYIDMSFRNDFNKYKKYGTINDHHQNIWYDDLLTEKIIVEWLNLKRQDIKPTSANTFKSTIPYANGSSWRARGNPHIPEPLLFQKVPRNVFDGIDFKYKTKEGYISQNPLNIQEGYFDDNDNKNIKGGYDVNKIWSLRNTFNTITKYTNKNINVDVGIGAIVDSFYQSIAPRLIKSVKGFSSIPHKSGNFSMEDLKTISYNKNIIFGVQGNYNNAKALIRMCELLKLKKT